MFDLRYHVASLAAVFLALLIGILVGVGISGRVEETEQDILREQLQAARAELEDAGRRSAAFDREQEATRSFIDLAYPLLIEHRLRDKGIAVLFVGSVDPGVRDSVDVMLDDAGGRRLRLRALKAPINVPGVQDDISGREALVRYQGADALDELGRALAGEFVEGDDTPAWDALSSRLVEEQTGTFRRPVDGVVVARTAEPQRADTARFLAGFYRGLADAGVPVIGVETSTENPSAVDVWDRAGLSTVDDVDTPAGRLALALLLGGAEPGNYGLKETAGDGILPEIESLPAEAGG